LKQTVVFLLLFIFCILSSLFILLNGNEILRRLSEYPNLKATVIICIISLLIYSELVNRSWEFLSQISGSCVAFILQFVGIPLQLFVKLANVDGLGLKYYIFLEHPSLRSYISAGCSGLEGIFFFITLFSVILMFDRKSTNWKAAFSVYLAGIVYMFALNIIRIVFFIVTALWLCNHINNPTGLYYFVWGFHANVGWLLYFTGILLFFAALRRYPLTFGGPPKVSGYLRRK